MVSSTIGSRARRRMRGRRGQNDNDQVGDLADESDRRRHARVGGRDGGERPPRSVGAISPHHPELRDREGDDRAGMATQSFDGELVGTVAKLARRWVGADQGDIVLVVSALRGPRSARPAG